MTDHCRVENQLVNAGELIQLSGLYVNGVEELHCNAASKFRDKT